MHVLVQGIELLRIDIVCEMDEGTRIENVLKAFMQVLVGPQCGIEARQQ